MLLDSVAPEVKIISLGWALISDAVCSLASSTICSALQPNWWVLEWGLPLGQLVLLIGNLDKLVIAYLFFYFLIKIFPYFNEFVDFFLSVISCKTNSYDILG